MSNPLISIIVLSFNQADKTVKCFKSISQCCSLPFELIWVDNASTSAEFAYMQRNMPIKAGVKLLRHKSNVGFVKGVNSAIPLINPLSQYVVLLNNDTEIGPGTFEKLIKPFKIKNVGITSCITQSKISWQSFENLNKRWPSLKIPNFKGNTESYTKQLEKQFKDKCIEIKGNNFAFFCVVMPRKVFVDELKGLDSDFDIGLGEDDFACHKLRHLGYKFYLVLEAFVYHHHRTTFKALNIDIDHLRRRNVATLRRKIKELANDRNE